MGSGSPDRQAQTLQSSSPGLSVHPMPRSRAPTWAARGSKGAMEQQGEQASRGCLLCVAESVRIVCMYCVCPYIQGRTAGCLSLCLSMLLCVSVSVGVSGLPVCACRARVLLHGMGIWQIVSTKVKIGSWNAGGVCAPRGHSAAAGSCPAQPACQSAALGLSWLMVGDSGEKPTGCPNSTLATAHLPLCLAEVPAPPSLHPLSEPPA